MLKKPISKESVGKVVLTATSILTVSLGSALYISDSKLEETREQLGEAQTRIVQNNNDYELLEQKFLSVESESDKLSKKQEELVSQLNIYKTENQELKSKVEKLDKSRARRLAINPDQTSPAGIYKNWKRMTVESTGYSLYDDPMGSDGTPQTSTGTYPKEGRTIAVDPRVIPYGTKVYIPAFNGVFIAEDTGGAIKGNKIDIYMSHGSKARQWGRQKIEVYVSNE